MSKSSKKSVEPIIIDKARGLIFNSEQDLYAHFEKEIEVFENEFNQKRRESDISESEFGRYDSHLDQLLDDPDEVWEDDSTPERAFIYLRRFDSDVTHVAICYLTDSAPSFVYLHFPTRDEDLVENYRRGHIAFQRPHENAPTGAIDGDALHEGDELAAGLYKAMMLVRSEKDIPEPEFVDYADLREETLNEPDEIWRSADTLGNVLVSFIREFGEDDDISYIVVTVEDVPSSSHALLFSFPTRDKGLVDRYRHGENLQAEEVVQESSH